MEISDMVVPVDFSPCSIRALDYALSMVASGGEVYLMNVIDSKLLARFEEYGLGNREEVTERLRARAEEKLDTLIADRQSTSRAKLSKMIVVGIPFVEILRISKDLDFSLIVMGTRVSSSLLEELLFGSTADKVLRGTQVPVICVP
jgi:nucleotide-binding universal stress UspA family protein